MVISLNQRVELYSVGGGLCSIGTDKNKQVFILGYKLCYLSQCRAPGCPCCCRTSHMYDFVPKPVHPHFFFRPESWETVVCLYFSLCADVLCCGSPPVLVGVPG